MIKINTFGSSSKGNCYRVSNGVTNLLLDCGLPIRKIKEKLDFGLNKVDGCLISHYHGDHSKAARDLIGNGINVFTSLETAKNLEISGHFLNIIEPKKQFRIGSWAIMPFDVYHDCPGSLGFLLQSGDDKLLFITDSAFTKYRFDGLTHIMIECNYQKEILFENILKGSVPPFVGKRIMETHFSLDNVAEFLKANDLSNLREIHLMHLSDGNSNANVMRDAVSRICGCPVYVCRG